MVCDIARARISVSYYPRDIYIHTYIYICKDSPRCVLVLKEFCLFPCCVYGDQNVYSYRIAGELSCCVIHVVHREQHVVDRETHSLQCGLSFSLVRQEAIWCDDAEKRVV